MAGRALRISKGRPVLDLPPEAHTETFGVVAMRGQGKTYLGLVIAEEMRKAGLPVVVVDPIGVCWGLRSNATGKGDGLDFLVIGGDHGDFPLEKEGGKLIADLVIDHRASVVLDLSHLRKGAAVRFMTDFAEQLYHKNREPIHLVVDEADAFAPQQLRGARADPEGNPARLLGAMEDLVRRGRARGIGLTLITQRPAVLNKNVLTQVAGLFMLRLVGPQDLDAVERWVRASADLSVWQELRRELVGLPKGVAYLWSPGFLDITDPQRVHVRRRETFDSSATPTGRSRKAPAAKLRPVDVESYAERMAAVVERTKANDPRELKAEIRKLRTELAKKPAASEPVEIVEIQVPPELRPFLDFLDAQDRERKAHADKVNAAIRKMLKQPKAKRAPVRARPTATTPTPTRKGTGAAAAPERNGIPPARRRILDALAWLESIGLATADRSQLAFLSDASPKSSAYGNNLGAMRTEGLLEYPGRGRVMLTDDGRALADTTDVPTTAEELQDQVRRKLPPAKWRILEVLLEVYPDAVERADLAARAGASPTSSAYGNNLGALRTLGLLDYPDRGYVVAAPVLSMEVE